MLLSTCRYLVMYSRKYSTFCIPNSNVFVPEISNNQYTLSVPRVSKLNTIHCTLLKFSNSNCTHYTFAKNSLLQALHTFYTSVTKYTSLRFFKNGPLRWVLLYCHCLWSLESEVFHLVYTCNYRGMFMVVGYFISSGGVQSPFPARN